MSNPTGTPDWIKSQLPENKPASPPERGRAVSGPPAGSEGGPPIRIASEPKPAPSLSGPRAVAGTSVIPQVSYYRKAFAQRVYPLVVRVKEGSQGAKTALPSGSTVEVRPVLPGAIVWPEKRVLREQETAARFWVLPLALGRLPDGHVNIQSGDGPSQRIDLPMRIKTGRGWLFRLCVWLTILLPIGFFVLRSLPVDYQHLRYTVHDEEGWPITHHGRFALEKWLEKNYNQAQVVAANERSVHNWLAILLYQSREVLLSAYDGYEMLLQDNMLTEPAVLAIMLAITLLVGWWTGPKLRTRTGEPLMLTGTP
jgi:hypothetical protein